MLPFFARTLTRREMALGCAVLSLALLLSALPAALRWGQAQLDTGALLCADTLPTPHAARLKSASVRRS